MFIDLQNAGPFSFNLNEALVQIMDKAACYDQEFGPITDNMICAASYYRYNGPCFVRIFNSIKFVCEILIFKSSTKIIIIISVRAV